MFPVIVDYSDLAINGGSNLANFGQNQMPVGTTMKRYSDHIGLYNTQVAGKMLQ